MEIKLQHRLAHQIVMTPQLQQAIKLLQLPRHELEDVIREELTQNPILDEHPDTDVERAPMSRDGTETRSIEQLAEMESRRENAPAGAEEHRAASETRNEDTWQTLLEQYSNQNPMPSSSVRSSSEEMPSIESTLTSRTSLSEYLMGQLRLSNFNEEEMRFAELVVHNLDENGYLNLKAITPPVSVLSDETTAVLFAGEIVEELAPHAHEFHEKEPVDERQERADHRREVRERKEASEREEEANTHQMTIEDLAREAKLDPEDAETVLRIIQSLDPVGVAARDLRECLLVQAENFGYETDDVVYQLIDRHLPNLEKRNFNAIARDLKCSVEDVYESAKLISTLEPRPGRNYSTDDPPYITPDVYVHKVSDDYIVSTNDDGLPKLKVNFEQAKALINKDARAKAFVQDKLNAARWFVRSLDQRHKTIVKVTRCIVDKQREFFERGIDFLKPMILRDVAEAVGMHESTISRVTKNKYVHTPRGIFELSYFFNSAIRRPTAEGDIASESVKQAIKKIIAEEEPKNPLSDEQIVKRLEEHKILIARRTVAKYRDMLGILSSAKRKQFY